MIRERRVASGWTQWDLAKHLDINNAVISALERGVTTKPLAKADVSQRLADWLQLSVADVKKFGEFSAITQQSRAEEMPMQVTITHRLARILIECGVEGPTVVELESVCGTLKEPVYARQLQDKGGCVSWMLLLEFIHLCILRRQNPDDPIYFTREEVAQWLERKSLAKSVPSEGNHSPGK